VGSSQSGTRPSKPDPSVIILPHELHLMMQQALYQAERNQHADNEIKINPKTKRAILVRALVSELSAGT